MLLGTSRHRPLLGIKQQPLHEELDLGGGFSDLVVISNTIDYFYE